MRLLRCTSLLLLSGGFSLPGTCAVVRDSVPGKTVICDADSGCTNEMLDGRVYRVLRTAEMEVKVSISTEGEYTRADVSIVNHSGAPLAVVPAEFHVDVLTPRARTLGYVEPASLRLPRGGAEVPKRVAAIAWVRPKPEPDLPAGEVGPEGAMDGRVFFERDRRAKMLQIVLPISGEVFEFPFRLQ